MKRANSATARRKSYPLPELLNLEEVARIIGTPVKDWPGNCYSIACALVEHGIVEGVAVYGHWTGPIAPTSLFADRRELGFCHHGWVVQPDGTVVDPTRYVFEARKPYIYVGRENDKNHLECMDFEPAEDSSDLCAHCDCAEHDHERGFFRPCRNCAWPYDEGGDRLRAANMQPAPAFDPGAKLIGVWFKRSPAARDLVLRELVKDATARGKTHLTMTERQLAWLANVPYALLQPHAYEVYSAIVRSKRAGLIPIDNSRRAEREKGRAL